VAPKATTGSASIASVTARPWSSVDSGVVRHGHPHLIGGRVRPVLGEGICVSQLRIALVPGGTLAATTSMTIAPSPAPGQQHAGRHPGKPGPLARRPRIF
jgi:hypothetical protein